LRRTKHSIIEVAEPEEEQQHSWRLTRY
jgi:hypothetical protein